MKTFHLQRDVDVTGVSGTGVVAQGVVFDDGSGATHWLSGDFHSTSLWPAPNAVEAIEKIHGHNGATRIVWHDEGADAVREVCAQVEANPVGWGGPEAVSLARTIVSKLG